jgi:hypothetical protein
MAKKQELAETAAQDDTATGTAMTAGSGGALAAQFEEMGHEGFENTDDQSFAIPFLIVLQSGSPQCKRSDGAYVKGAEEGMLYNTVTGELYNGDDGVTVIPCFYKRSFIEWAPRDSGGGFKGEHPPSSPLVSQIQRTDKGDVLPNGNLLVDTRTHYVLILKEDGSFQPAVVAMSSTQVKKSRQWMSKMDGIKFKNAAGQMYTPPMFSHTYLLSTTPEQNDQGSWFGWKVGAATLLEDPVMFAAAKEFKRAVSAGEVKEQVPQDAAAPSTNGDDVPY